MPDKVINTWHPDTCGCEITFSWERGSSEDDRVHAAEGFTPCEAHKHHTDQHQHFAAVLEENQRKNKVVTLLGEKHGVSPIEFRFSFDERRALSVTHPELDLSQYQAEVDKEHGKGKVKLG